jgi:hypothetical protein
MMSPAGRPAAPPETRLRRYPASSRFVVHPAAGREARWVRSLAGTSDRRRSALDRLGAGAIGLLGTRMLPLAPPWVWPELGVDRLLDELGAPLPGLQLIAAVVPRQPARPRLSLLCRWRDARVVVKLGTPGDGLAIEALALELLTADPLPGIMTPALLTAGETPGQQPLSYLATSALGLGRQQPAVGEPLRTFESDLATRLAGLPRPDGTPDDHVPVHGDLAPWNLRRTPRGLALFDWEGARWAPPGTDLDQYRRACATLGRRGLRFRS